ncbi:MAG TPA: zinc-binding dehydrogenase [Euzebyales bacterium]|nr:zinc-binding dehydrogenase [Euzebyales bacterium]
MLVCDGRAHAAPGGRRCRTVGARHRRVGWCWWCAGPARAATWRTSRRRDERGQDRRGVGVGGADVVLDRDRPDLDVAVRDATGGVDVFADVVGGDWFAPLLETIRRGGHYTTAGAVAGPLVPLDLRTLYLHDLTFHGATVVPPGVFAALVRHVERGEITPRVARTFPLEELAAGQAAFMTRRHVGAIVIEIAT